MDELIPYSEAAGRLSVSRATLFRMIAAGTLTPVRVPRPSGRGTLPRLRAAEVEAHRIAATTTRTERGGVVVASTAGPRSDDDVAALIEAWRNQD